MKLLDNILDFLLGARYKEYTPALRILTKNERNFYHALKYYFKDCYILPKVCLRSIFEVSSRNMSIKDASSKAANSKSDAFSLNAKIKHKHVDFTVINKNLEIEYCFELDDNSHYYPSSQTRDMLVGEIFDDGGIKLVRVLSARHYDEYTISEALSNLISPEASHKHYKPKKLFSKNEAAKFLELANDASGGEIICYKISLREFFTTINEDDKDAFYYLSKRLVSFAIYDDYDEQIKKIIMLSKADKEIIADRFFKKLCQRNNIKYAR